MKTQSIFAGLAIIIGGTICVAGANFGDKTADQLRDEASKLIAKAQDLKADGHGDEATKLARQAEELQQAAGQLEKQREKRADQSKAQRDAARELDELRARLKELESSGKTDEATMIRRRLEEIENIRREEGTPEPREKTRRDIRSVEKEIRQSKRPAQARTQPREEGRQGAPAGGFGDFERRREHVLAAIENLRVAELPEAAERLERALEKMDRQPRESPEVPRPRNEFRARGEMAPSQRPVQPFTPLPPANPVPRFQAPGPADRPGQTGDPEGFRPRDQELRAQISELQNEVRELRRALKELRSHLEERLKER